MPIIDFRRISRWCLLGTVLMLIWLLAPVARCSFTAFKDTPLGQISADGAPPSEADRDAVKGGEGFFHDWIARVTICYARTPLLGQEDWKSDVLMVLGGATLLSYLLGRYGARGGGRTRT